VADFIRIILLLAIGAAALTFIGSAAAWWMEDQRRLRRLVRKVLGGPPDGVIVAPGRGAAAGFRLASQQVVVMNAGGAKALLYRLSALLGAELIVDDKVVARTMRDEPRRVLDHVDKQAQHVTLRLLFDDARHPDFILDLWVPRDGLGRHGRPAAAAIREARGWLIRSEAILRRSAPAAVASQPPPWRTAPGPEPEAPALPEHDDSEIDLLDDALQVETARPGRARARPKPRHEPWAAPQELPWGDPEDEPRLL
jgi:hypothetical protein